MKLFYLYPNPTKLTQTAQDEHKLTQTWQPWSSVTAALTSAAVNWTEVRENMMEIRLNSKYLELLFLCLCLLTVLKPANGKNCPLTVT